MTVFQQEAAKQSLKAMFAKGHFSICAVDEILKMTGGVPEAADYSALRMLHCVDFKDMSPSLRIEFQKALERVLTSPGMTVEINFKPAPLAVRLLN